ncbi:MAG: hypothetical protein AAFV07_21325, partial [Bacteroidota bacterium]
NLAYNEEDWLLPARFVIRNPEEKLVICEFSMQKEVRVDQPEFHLREGWGNADYGAFWNPGTYQWELYIEDHKLAVHPFYVYEAGEVNPVRNPYFQLHELRLFEGPGVVPPERNRHYTDRFPKSDTRYVWVELALESNLPYPWYNELYIRFFNESRQLKGETQELFLMPPRQGPQRLVSGWGANQTGTWGQSKYSIDILFMNQIIYQGSFEVT